MAILLTLVAPNLRLARELRAGGHDRRRVAHADHGYDRDADLLVNRLVDRLFRARPRLC